MMFHQATSVHSQFLTLSFCIKLESILPSLCRAELRYYRSLVNTNGMRLFLDNRAPSIAALNAKTTSPTIKLFFTLCRPFVIYAFADLMPSFYLMCNKEKKLRRFLDLSRDISRVSVGLLGFVHLVICQKYSVLDDTGDILSGTISRVMLW